MLLYITLCQRDLPSTLKIQAQVTGDVQFEQTPEILNRFVQEGETCFSVRLKIFGREGERMVMGVIESCNLSLYLHVLVVIAFPAHFSWTLL